MRDIFISWGYFLQFWWYLMIWRSDVRNCFTSFGATDQTYPNCYFALARSACIAQWIRDAEESISSGSISTEEAAQLIVEVTIRIRICLHCYITLSMNLSLGVPSVPLATTVCPRSSDPFCIVTYYIKWVTTSWTDGVSSLLPKPMDQ